MHKYPRNSKLRKQTAKILCTVGVAVGCERAVGALATPALIPARKSDSASLTDFRELLFSLSLHTAEKEEKSKVEIIAFGDNYRFNIKEFLVQRRLTDTYTPSHLLL